MRPKRIFYGELQKGTRSQGDQKKWFKDTLKASLKDFSIDHTSWETLVWETLALLATSTPKTLGPALLEDGPLPQGSSNHISCSRC